jgi:hypothetical protein
MLLPLWGWKKDWVGLLDRISFSSDNVMIIVGRDFEPSFFHDHIL